MSDSNDQTCAPSTDPALARAERRLARLDEVADLALELCRATQRKALEALAARPADQPDGPDPVAPFDKAARALRLTSALQAKLEEDLKTCRREAEARAKVARKPAQLSPLARRKDVLAGCVEEVIDTDVEGREAILLRAELNERLETESEDDERRLLERPIGVVLSEIFRDLGLAPDWSLWEEDGWAIAETRDRVRGSPYAAPPYVDRKYEQDDEAARHARDRRAVIASLGP